MADYINENEFDENERNKSLNSERNFVATPKLLFFYVLVKNLDLSFADERLDQAWDDFENWVRKYYGKGEFVGAVAFDKKGGEFVPMIAIQPSDIPPPGDDDVPSPDDEDDD